ncbi:hypothetical protein DFQ26_003123 [Actinomortierella ambigua]|nr:hypothetical protein DFQ26_003123 [Actinomortierella ambigua]
MFGLKQTLKALFCGALLLASVSAQEEAPATSIPAGLPINVAVEFPNAIEGLVPGLIGGEANKLKISFENLDQSEYKVNLIVGSIFDLQDFTNIRRNLTAYRYGTTIKRENTLILPYTVKVEHPSIEAGLILMADITNKEKEHFTAIVYNGTVSFSEPVQSLLDVQLIFLYVLLAGIFVGLGIFIKDSFKSEAKTTKKKPALTAEQRQVAVDNTTVLNDDWIPENHKKSPKAAKVTKRR